MNSFLKKLTALAGLSVALVAPASAIVLTVNEGLSGAVGGMVGTVDPGSPADLDSEVVYINTLLGLNANVVTTISGKAYDTTAFNFNGSVSAAGALNYPENPPLSGPAGYQWVLGKFGNTAYVWYLGGESFTIPSTVGQGGGLSHWAAFSPASVPDGGTTIALLGLGLAALAVIRRKMVR